MPVRYGAMSEQQDDVDLERWLGAALEAAGLSDADPSLRSAEAVTAVLDLARHAAHGVTRPAAPLSTFALGLALGRSGGDGDALRDLAGRIGYRARVWNDEENA